MKKYIYEIYCEKGQTFDSDNDNFSLFIETNKKLKCYCKTRTKENKLQKQLEKLLKKKLYGYHIVWITDYITWDLDDVEIIKLDKASQKTL